MDTTQSKKKKSSIFGVAKLIRKASVSLLCIFFILICVHIFNVSLCPPSLVSYISIRVLVWQHITVEKVQIVIQEGYGFSR